MWLSLMCASVVNNALMVLEHRSPGADAQVWSSLCKACCVDLELCSPHAALTASYEAVRSSYRKELHRQLPPGPTHLQQGWQGGAPCLTGHLALPADNPRFLPCINRRAMLQSCQASLEPLANPVCMYIATKHVGKACSNTVYNMHELVVVLLQMHATSLVKETSIQVESVVDGSDLRSSIAQGVTHVAAAC